MKIASDVAGLRAALKRYRAEGKSVGLVPTMGAFHAGHLALMRTSAQEMDRTVTSLFVNPIQFGPAEDLARYPRCPESDARQAAEAGVDLLFTPGAAEMYPPGFRSRVEVAGLSDRLCGIYRPGHFSGVATVVLKLLNLVQPDRAYFGWKDAQQLLIIKRLVRDLNLPVEIVGMATVREKDGLALSSRNRYLEPAERRAAPRLYQVLREIADRLAGHPETAIEPVLAGARRRLEKSALIRLQYLEAVDPETLDPAGDESREVLVALAAWIGSTRLIDNIMVSRHG
ncbi:MAG TPA: pantoate--beta-alanine ligase [bacterium]|uniref:Pantothenate synthetase n=1 Tax=candidate division TA06 bacterium ADurb.Bin417 TaxID=1852828 RepID=A0A1V5ML21_UNCT6|nr:MAG: Pantothenate synthetase [candidate division TA06 bacterium ADurb.Bin417]HNQ35408.1 pantoate--beta-alanine ligase [bacterium]